MHLRAFKELATIISEKLQQSWSSLGYLLKAGILRDGTVRSPASLTAKQNQLLSSQMTPNLKEHSIDCWSGWILRGILNWRGRQKKLHEQWSFAYFEDHNSSRIMDCWGRPVCFWLFIYKNIFTYKRSRFQSLRHVIIEVCCVLGTSLRIEI